MADKPRKLGTSGSPVVARRAAKDYPPLVVQELDTLEQQIGGRTEIVGMLTLAPLTPDLRHVLGMLGDPGYARTRLAEVCAIGGILPSDLIKHLTQACLARGRLLATQHVGNGIAAVAQDVMRRAAPYEDTCNGGCDGTGSLTPEPSPAQPNPVPSPCPTCKGSGVLKYQPELERQKMAIDMAQLLPKSQGIQIAQITNNAGYSGGSGGSGTGALEMLQRLSDRVLYGNGPKSALRAQHPHVDPDRPDSAEGEIVEIDENGEKDEK